MLQGEEGISGGQKWFTPVNGPQGFLVCAASFCDYVIHTGQIKLGGAGDSLARVLGPSVRCCFGQSNTSTLAARMLEMTDYDPFWKGTEAVGREPICDAKVSQPGRLRHLRRVLRDRGRTTRAASLFTPKKEVPPGATWICSFNPAIPRYSMHMLNLLGMIYTKDPGLLERFVNEYAYIPPCRRATHLDDARWFGWEQCTSCQECHHMFARGTALAGSMPLPDPPPRSHDGAARAAAGRSCSRPILQQADPAAGHAEQQ
ncbi:hypothetical protein DL770_011855 [Monosporascus sp. CRB-9-2]|nr:hypothetical protein DL770_011855 [Monosporascus sp. CRB-9-2]